MRGQQPAEILLRGSFDQTVFAGGGPADSFAQRGQVIAGQGLGMQSYRGQGVSMWVLPGQDRCRLRYRVGGFTVARPQGDRDELRQPVMCKVRETKTPASS